MKHGILGIILLVGFSPLAIARDDVDFARALARGGYLELAEEVCASIEKDSRFTADDRAGIPFIKSEIRLVQAELETDMTKSGDLIKEAIGLLEKFVKDTKDAKLAADAQTTMGWIRMKQAQLITEALKTETDAETVAGMRKQALGLYQEVEKAHRDQIKRLKAAESTADNVSALIDSIIELGRTTLEHGKLPGVDDAEKKKLLTDNINMLEEFEFDYGDRPVAFEAMRIEGLCFQEMGQMDKAEGKLRLAAGLRERLAEAGIEPNDYHRNVMRGGVLALVRMLIKAGRHKEAVTAADAAFKEDKDLANVEPGMVLALEKAQALFESGDSAGANAVAKKIMDKDPNGRWAGVARDKVKSWISAGRGKMKIPPDQLLSAAEASMDREQWHDALAGLRECIEACTTDAEREKFVAGSWYKMGQIHLVLNRKYEAAAAFETVYLAWPKNVLAAKACFDAARCYAGEFNASGDPTDEKRKDDLLKALHTGWPDHPAAFNVPYMEGEKLETAKEFKKAAESYLTVKEQAEAYEASLVRAGYCFFTAAASAYSKTKKDDAAKAEAAAEMKKAEQVLTKFLTRYKDNSLVPSDPELQKIRTGLSFIAANQLALVYIHETVGRAKDCLVLIEEAIKALAPDDERNSKLWSLKIQAFLALGELDKAIAVLDEMFERFPDGGAIAQASKSVAVRLHEVAMTRIDKKESEDLILTDLKRLAKYYTKWLDQGPSAGLRISMNDVVSVADTLYLVAKRVNGLDETQVSFLDLKGKTLAEPQYFRDAAFVHAMLVEGKAGKLADKDRLNLVIRLARCYGFIAIDQPGWDKAKQMYSESVKTYGLVDENDNLKAEVLSQFPALLAVYLELGSVFLEIGRMGSKFQFDNAVTVFANVSKVTPPGSEPWWICKYMTLNLHFLRGKGNDFDMAKIGMENTERNNPDFVGAPPEIKTKLIALKAELAKIK